MGTQDELEEISLAGHAAFDQADALNGVIAQFHRTHVTVADLILGGLPAGVPMKQHRENLAKAEAVLKKYGDATFTRLGQPDSLEFAVSQLRQAITSAERYAVDRKR